MSEVLQAEKVQIEVADSEAELHRQGLHFGYVGIEIEKRFSVECSGMKLFAMKAASCLITPAPGDYVACVVNEKKTFIIAVLERKAPKAVMEIVSNAPIGLSAPEIKMVAKDQLFIAGQKGALTFGDLNLGAVNFAANIEKGDVRIKILSYIGKSLKIVLNEVLARVGTSLRIVDGADYQRSKEVHIESEKLLSLKGQFTSVTAKDDVKIDGTRVHIG